MANGFMKILMSGRTYGLSAVVAVFTWLMGWLVNFLNLKDTLNIGGQTVSTGALSLNLNLGTVTQTFGTANALGTRAMALLTAIPGGLFEMASLMALLTIFIGSSILVILGKWIYSFKIAPKGKANWKLAVQLLYGAILGMIIIGGFGGVGFSAVITLAVYYGIIGLIGVPVLTRVKFFSRLARD